MYDQQQYHDPYKQQQPPHGAYGQPQQAYYAQPQQYAYGQNDGYGQTAPPMGGGYNNAPEVTAIKPETAPSGACRDWPFAVLFLVNVGAIVALTVMWGLDAIKDDDKKSTTTTKSSKNNAFLTADETRNTILVACGMAVISIVLALAAVKLIVAYARCMINFTLWFNVVIAFALAALGFAIGNLVLGILGTILALLSLCYARAVQHRIPFAAANLKVAAAAISKHWSTYLVAILFTLVQVVWVVLWSLAFLGVANELKSDDDATTTSTKLSAGDRCTNNSQCESNSCRYLNGYYQCYGSSTTTFYKDGAGQYVAYFFLVLSFYWGLQVFKNISHTTIAGTVATFWYNAESAGATGSSLVRSMTTSFGSICFGSLLVAIIQAFRQLAEQARQEGNCLACLAECLLACLQAIMEYINRWAYVYVGIYGYKFTQAGKAVFQLFHDRGFDAIINDDLIGTVLSFAALAVGLICAGAGALVANYTDIVDFEHSTVFLAVLGFIVGVGIAVTPLSVIDSSVATIFVCFAEDPNAFLQSHPDLYHPLVAEWHNLYPEIMVAAGYWRARVEQIDDQENGTFTCQVAMYVANVHPQAQYAHVYTPQYGYEANGHTQHGPAPIKPERGHEGDCRDGVWAMLFVFDMMILAFVGVMYGFMAIYQEEPNAFLPSKETITALVICGGLAVLSAVLAAIALVCITSCASSTTPLILLLSVLVAFGLAALGFVIHNFVLGVLAVLVTLVVLFHVRDVKSRVLVARTHFRVAAVATQKCWSAYLVAMLFTVLQIAWSVLCAGVLLVVANHLKNRLNEGEWCYEDSECYSNQCQGSTDFRGMRTWRCSSPTTFTYNNNTKQYVIYCVLLLAFYWGLQIFKFITHTIVAGTVAPFWYNSRLSDDVWRALGRSMKSSCGSICFGAFVLPIIQLFRRSGNMEHSNRWALVYVSVYGQKFTQASKSVFDLFHQRGFEAVFNTNLAAHVVGSASLAIGLICAGTGAVIAHWTDLVGFEHSSEIFSILGFIMGVGIASTPLSIIESSVATMLVCFTEDPTAIAHSHPDLYHSLVAEWQNVEPEMIAQAGYHLIDTL
ncbi:hypothetical protein Poli38472_000528 [Pythium oligandrum]|uniref:Choline transporter-like protein n=1 Tax=Pythium oligandrum TaxID=41045 RepID=A0A8K1CBX1_PYTOL|nr:hypothetical protein Poli38472_000528 [Pythium oligandrum]|eukprot:TMW60486.1 hypothetical protein Poli38472_000528 [Pythium oligandrum]